MMATIEIKSPKERDNLEDTQKEKPRRYFRLLAILSVLGSFLIVLGVKTFQYIYRNQEQTSICNGQNEDAMNDCNCLNGYYRTGKNQRCVGPFNEEIFSHEEIKLSLANQDDNIAHKLHKRHLSQSYIYTKKALMGEQQYQQAGLEDYEIHTITEDVTENENTVIIYLKEVRASVNGQQMNVQKFPPKSNQQNTNSQVNQDNLSEWQQWDAEKQGISFEKYFFSQLPIIRVVFSKNGEIIRVDTPVNLPQNINEIFIDFLELYSPKLDEKEYHSKKFQNEENEYVEEQLERNFQEEGAHNQYTQYQTHTQMNHNLDQNEASDGKTFPNNIISHQKNFTMSNEGYLKQGQSSFQQYFYHNDNRLEQNGINVEQHDNIELQETKILSEDQTSFIKQFLDQMSVLSLNEEEYIQRYFQVIGNITDSQEQNKNENDDDNNRRMLYSEDRELFDKFSLHLFHQDIYGTIAEGGISCECYKNVTHQSYIDCFFTPFAQIGDYNFISLGKASASIDISRVKDTNQFFEELYSLEQNDEILSQVSIQGKKIYGYYSTFNKLKKKFKKYKFGLKLDYEPQFELSHKVFAKLRKQDGNLLSVVSSLQLDLGVKCFVVQDLILLLSKAEIEADLFHGVHNFTIDFRHDQNKERSQGTVRSDISIEPIELKFSVYFQHITFAKKEWCIPWIYCFESFEPVYSNPLYLYGPKEIFNTGELFTSHQFGLTFYYDSRLGEVIGNQLQIQGIQKNKNKFTPNQCKKIKVTSESAISYEQVGYINDYSTDYAIGFENRNISGIHLVIFDQQTLQNKTYEIFKTQDNSTESTRIINYIQNNITTGDFVIIFNVDKQAINNLSHEAIQEIENNFGVNIIDNQFSAFSQKGRHNGQYLNNNSTNGVKTLKIAAQICTQDTDFIEVKIADANNTGVGSGFEDRPIFQISYNGYPFSNVYAQDTGFYVGVIDPINVYVKQQRTFQTNNNLDEVQAAMDYIRSIKHGEYVVYAFLSNDASNFTSETFYTVLENQLGYDHYKLFRSTLASVVRKGFSIGQGQCVDNNGYRGSIGIVMVSLNIVNFNLGETCKHFEVASNSNEVKFTIDNFSPQLLSTRGVVIIVYDEYSMEWKQSKEFDLDSNDGATYADLDQFTKTIAIGDYVLISINNIENYGTSWDLQLLLQTNFQINQDIQLHSSFSAIVRKGFDSTIYSVKNQGQEGTAYVKSQLCGYSEKIFTVESETSDHINSYVVKRDGEIMHQEIHSYSTGGLAVTVIDQNTFEKKKSRIFDGFKKGVQFLYEFLEDVPVGDIVAYGVYKDATFFLDNQVYSYLETFLGYDRNWMINSKDNMVAIARKGAQKGQAVSVKNTVNSKSQISVSSNGLKLRKDTCNKVEVIASGTRLGKYAKVLVDGVNVDITNSTGLNFFIYDKNTLIKKQSKYFNTSAGQLEAQQIPAFIDSIFDGDFVIVTLVNDDQQGNINIALSSFSQIGLNNIHFNYEEGFVALGQKGAHFALFEQSIDQIAQLKGSLCKGDDKFLEIVSKGSKDSTGYFDVKINGVSQLPLPAQPGLNIAVFDKDTLQIKSQKSFQHKSETHELMMHLQDEINEGDLIAYGIQDNAKELFSTHGKKELEFHLGYNYRKFKVSANDSMAGLVRKGMEKDEGLTNKRHVESGEARIFSSHKFEDQDYDDQNALCKEMKIKSEYNTPQFYVDGVQQYIFDEVGLHFIVFDKYTLKKRYTRVFDTGSHPELIEKIIFFIEYEIHAGDFVLIATTKYANFDNLNADFYHALQFLGIYNYTFKENEKFAAFCQKGFDRSDQHALYDYSKPKIVLIQAIACAHTEHHFSVKSKALHFFDDSSYPHQFIVKRNNETIFENTQEQGLAFVTMNKFTGKYSSHKIFDVENDTEVSQKIMDYLSIQSDGDYIAFGVCKRIINYDNINYELRDYLELNIGIDQSKLNLTMHNNLIGFSRIGEGNGQSYVQNLETLYNGVLLMSISDKVFPFNTFQMCQDIYIQAQSIHNFNSALYLVNGIPITGPSPNVPNTGDLILAIFDGSSLRYKYSKSFYFNGQESETKFEEIISYIPSGDYVAITVSDQKTGSLPASVITELQNIGFNQTMVSGQGLAIIGQKGSSYQAMANIYNNTNNNNTNLAINSNILGTMCSLEDKFIKMQLNVDLEEIFYDYGNYSVKTSWLQKKGLNIFVFDKDTKKLKQSKVYHKDSGHSSTKSFLKYIKDLQYGDYAVYSFHKSNSSEFHIEALAYLEYYLGYDLTNFSIDSNTINIFWSIVGMRKGKAKYSIKQINQGHVYLFANPKEKLIETELKCVEVESQSGGSTNSEFFASFYHDGQYQNMPQNTQGIYLIVYDQNTLNPKDWKTFDVQNPTEQNLMQTFIEDIIDGDYVSVAVKGDGHSGMTYTGWYALSLIGITEQIHINQQYVALGIKGKQTVTNNKNSMSNNRLTDIKSIICSNDESTLMVESKGFHTDIHQSYYFEVIVDTQKIYHSTASGFHVVVINPYTLAMESVKSFDTDASDYESYKLSEFIFTIPIGHIVAYGVCNKATTNLTQEAKESMETYLGNDFTKYNLTGAGSMAVLARKGHTKGRALVKLLPEGQGQAVVSASKSFH